MIDMHPLKFSEFPEQFSRKPATNKTTSSKGLTLYIIFCHIHMSWKLLI